MNDIPLAVRILPMNLRDEFPDGYTVERAQQWFREELSSRENGEYRCYRGLRAKPGTVVLFQCEAHIIATGVLTGHDRYPKPDEDGYTGCLYFDVKSICTFDPIGPEALRKVWPEFRKFSHAMLELDPKKYQEFKRQLTKVK